MAKVTDSPILTRFTTDRDRTRRVAEDRALPIVLRTGHGRIMVYMDCPKMAFDIGQESSSWRLSKLIDRR